MKKQRIDAKNTSLSRGTRYENVNRRYGGFVSITFETRTPNAQPWRPLAQRFWSTKAGDFRGLLAARATDGRSDGVSLSSGLPSVLWSGREMVTRIVCQTPCRWLLVTLASTGGGRLRGASMAAVAPLAGVVQANTAVVVLEEGEEDASWRSYRDSLPGPLKKRSDEDNSHGLNLRTDAGKAAARFVLDSAMSIDVVGSAAILRTSARHGARIS